MALLAVPPAGFGFSSLRKRVRNDGSTLVKTSELGLAAVCMGSLIVPHFSNRLRVSDN